MVTTSVPSVVVVPSSVADGPSVGMPGRDDPSEGSGVGSSPASGDGLAEPRGVGSRMPPPSALGLTCVAGWPVPTVVGAKESSPPNTNRASAPRTPTMTTPATIRPIVLDPAGPEVRAGSGRRCRRGLGRLLGRSRRHATPPGFGELIVRRAWRLLERTEVPQTMQKFEPASRWFSHSGQ